MSDPESSTLHLLAHQTTWQAPRSVVYPSFSSVSMRLLLPIRRHTSHHRHQKKAVCAYLDPAIESDVPLAVEYADLAIIDLSKAKTEVGRKALAAEMVSAMATHGFFYVIGHGYTQEQVRPGTQHCPYMFNSTFSPPYHRRPECSVLLI